MTRQDPKSSHILWACDPDLANQHIPSLWLLCDWLSGGHATVRPMRPQLRLLLEQFKDTLFIYLLQGLLATRRMEGFGGWGGRRWSSVWTCSTWEPHQRASKGKGKGWSPAVSVWVPGFIHICRQICLRSFQVAKTVFLLVWLEFLTLFTEGASLRKHNENNWSLPRSELSLFRSDMGYLVCGRP